MLKRRIRIGILGSGGYGATARRYFRNTGEFEIVACMDTTAGVAVAAAAEESARAYTDLERFLAHPGMEAVSINTPVLCHVEHSRASLDAGKHVFITKPIAAFVEEAESIAALAQSKQLVYMVGHHTRHMPVERLVADVIQQGRLGRVCNAMIASCSSAGLVQSEKDWRVQAGLNPGGPLLQCGIHTIDFLLGLFGKVETIASFMQDDVTQYDVVDNTISLIRFSGGVPAAFVCNYTTAYMHTMHFFGTKANLHVHQHVTGLHQSEVYLQQCGRGDHEPWQALPIPCDATYPDPHGGVLERQFADQVRSGTPDYRNVRDAIDALRVIHAAMESDQSENPVTIHNRPVGSESSK